MRTDCYSLNVCVPLQFSCSNVIPKVMMVLGSGNLWKCFDHKRGVVKNGINILIRETPES